MEVVYGMLVNADTAMVAVTFAICQIVKRMLPSPPPPETPGESSNPWAVLRRMAWIPFATAFIVGVVLAVAFDPDPAKPMVLRIRGGLQTGAYSVVAWESWSNTKKLFGG